MHPRTRASTNRSLGLNRFCELGARTLGSNSCSVYVHQSITVYNSFNFMYPTAAMRRLDLLDRSIALSLLRRAAQKKRSRSRAVSFVAYALPRIFATTTSTVATSGSASTSRLNPSAFWNTVSAAGGRSAGGAHAEEERSEGEMVTIEAEE